MKQISAVEQLQECLSIHLSHDQQMKFEGLFQQALETEKQQKIEFAKRCLDKALDLDVRTAYSKIEQYYQETFK
jgi:hypothetical protein